MTDEADDKRWIDVSKRIAAGDPVSDEDRAFVARISSDRVAQFRAQKAALRTGDTARAAFYRMKDERLSKFGPTLAALAAYQAAKRLATEERPVCDDDAEALFRGYALLRWVIRSFEDDEQDVEALEIARQCFDHMEPLTASVHRRWL